MTNVYASDGRDPPAPSPATHRRYDQMFPTLTPQEIERLQQYGAVRNFADGERLFATATPDGACSWSSADTS